MNGENVEGNILLVDDEMMILQMQKNMLEYHGYKCLIAQNLTEAISLLETSEIDLALLDINLKVESGIELLKRIKKSFLSVAVIMTTGNDDYNTAMECMKLGADDYLAKPFPEGKLVISVRNVLAKKQLNLKNCQLQKSMEEKLLEQEAALKNSQVMLIQQEKLAAIGQLAAGVAHEINNPLGFIASNLSSLQRYCDKFRAYLDAIKNIYSKGPIECRQELEAEKKKYKVDLLIEDLPDLISDAKEGIDRIQKIVDGLKCFSRQDSEVRTPVDLNNCLESAVTIVWNEIKYNCKIERNFRDIPTVSGYPQQLAQVFMNLIVNASHAIEKDGLIELETRTIENSVSVTISDNGSGISEKNLTKIFDPFFTTKEVGKGTGLGMSIAREIIEKHSGKIEVESTLGQGTRFAITLPVNAKE